MKITYVPIKYCQEDTRSKLEKGGRMQIKVVMYVQYVEKLIHFI